METAIDIPAAPLAMRVDGTNGAEVGMCRFMDRSKGV
jgi:hypothetical protein